VSAESTRWIMGRSKNYGASGSAESGKPKGRWKIAGRQEVPANSIVHLTAAAAAKAAATALLTNQVVSGVSVTLFDGKRITFKVAKCLIESDSVLCSVLGSHEVPLEIPETEPLEVWVRVAWEQSLVPATQSAIPEITSTVLVEENANGPAELHWLSLELASNPAIESPLVPLLLYFTSAPDDAQKLQEIPRDLIIGSVKEALQQVPLNRLEQGVKVIVSLSKETEVLINVPPYIQTDFNKAVAPALERKLNRLVLALDQTSAETAAMLCQGAEEAWLSLPAMHLSAQSVLHEISLRPTVKMVSLCGSISTVAALADNNFSGITSNQLREDFINMLLFGRDLSPTVVQSLKIAATTEDLMQMVNRQRVGWLLDEMCRFACLNTRKILPSLRVEAIVFGSSGAILGRATLEPGVFQL
jgi:cobalamin biosynthesis protein CbiD